MIETDCAEYVAGPGEDELIEIGQRDDEAYAVRLDELLQRRDVAGVVLERDERVLVAVVERGRVGAGVGSDRRGAGLAEGGNGVDAHADAREENGRHGERG